MGRINLPNRSASAAARRRSRSADRPGPRRGRAGDGRAARRGGAPPGPAGAVAGADRARGNSTRTLLVRIAAEHDEPRDQRLCRHLRRHHRAAVGAAQGGLGRHRPPHRARDQEPADADPALGRAAAAQIPEGDQERSPRPSRICTDTIIRHVGDIGRMVDEFSSFARMPAPVLQARESGRDRAPGGVPAAHRRIPRSPSRPASPTQPGAGSPAMRRLVGQALINIVKNADRIDRGAHRRSGDEPAGPHRASPVDRADGQVAVDVEDNGKGLPQQGRERLTEPYVTTRAKGTGLGSRHRQEDHGRSSAAS